MGICHTFLSGGKLSVNNAMTDHRIYVIMEKCMKSILYNNKYFYISSEGYVFRPIT